MLQTWTMATPVLHGHRRAGRLPGASPRGDRPWPSSTTPGYVGTLATDSEFEIVRYLRLGEVVSATTVFESISEEKADPDRAGAGSSPGSPPTRWRPGRWSGRQTFRILKFDPSGAAA